MSTLVGSQANTAPFIWHRPGLCLSRWRGVSVEYSGNSGTFANNFFLAGFGSTLGLDGDPVAKPEPR